MKKGENRVLWRMQGDEGATEMSEVMGGDEGREMMRVHLHGTDTDALTSPSSL